MTLALTLVHTPVKNAYQAGELGGFVETPRLLHTEPSQKHALPPFSLEYWAIQFEHDEKLSQLSVVYFGHEPGVAVAVAVTEAVDEGEADTEAAFEGEADTEAAFEGERVAEDVAVTDAVIEDVSITDGVTEVDAVSDADSDVDAITDAVSDVDAITDAVSDDDTDTDSVTEVDTDTDPVTEGEMLALTVMVGATDDVAEALKLETTTTAGAATPMMAESGA